MKKNLNQAVGDPHRDLSACGEVIRVYVEGTEVSFSKFLMETDTVGTRD